MRVYVLCSPASLIFFKVGRAGVKLSRPLASPHSCGVGVARHDDLLPSTPFWAKRAARCGCAPHCTAPAPQRGRLACFPAAVLFFFFSSPRAFPTLCTELSLSPSPFRLDPDPASAAAHGHSEDDYEVERKGVRKGGKRPNLDVVKQLNLFPS